MKRILLSMLAAGACAAALAVPAMPGWLKFTQPDGTVIDIRMVGDEFGSMIFTEGGLLLVEVDGALEYARFDEDGFPKGSGILAKAGNEELAVSMNLQNDEKLGKWADMLIEGKNARLAERREAAALRKIATRGEDAADERAVPLNYGREDVTFPVLGDQKGLVILVEYQDLAFEHSDYDYFNRMLNEEGFSDRGSLSSARDWFIYNSGGKFVPQFDVYGPVKLPHERSYYGGNTPMNKDSHASEMAIDACTILDDEVDFSQYDRDGDGIIDNVFIFYAGEGEHESAVSDHVWPHSWDVAEAKKREEFFFDGVKLSHYACTCEYLIRFDRADGIGTFVHEFSHVMGLPDLYVTQFNGVQSFTPGTWSVLDYGSYCNDGLTPTNYSSFERCALGWIDMVPLAEGETVIPELTSTNVAYALPTEKPNEFYFFENRQQLGNDQFLPGHGMLVWHIDYKKDVWNNNKVNNAAYHQNVDLVEADNVQSDDSRDGDPFPGTAGVTSFGFETKPKLASWNKKQLAYDIENIAESADGVISFNVVPSGSAVGEMGVAGKDEAVYFDLMGRSVKDPSSGIYIRVIDGKSEKITVK